MEDIPQDTQNDHDWWLAEETDTRWQQHMQYQAELRHTLKEISDAQGKRYDHEQVSAKGRLRR